MNLLTMAHRGNKSYLPEKPCAHCGRPMSWRKKWARDWDTVRYCSDACRRQAKQLRQAPKGQTSPVNPMERADL